MAWNGMTLTTSGRRALSKAQAEDTLKIHSIAIGDGNPPANFNSVEGLISPKFEITELSIDITDTGCVITGDFPKVNYDYYFRELGVTVETSGGIKLYAYDNCGSDAEYIVNTSTIESTSKRVRIELIFSNISNVTVSHPSVLYVSYEDLDNKVNTLKTTVYEDFGKKADNLQEQISRSNNTRNIQVRASNFTTQGPYTQRIDLAGIKSTDVPEIALIIPDGVTDSARVKAIKKAWSCVDRIDTYDGYIVISCFVKKPETDILLLMKGV